MARGIGADARNVSRWAMCRATPNAIWVARIADHLKVPLDELFGRESPGGDPMPKIRECAQRILTLAGERPVAGRRTKNAKARSKKAKRKKS